MDGIHDMGGMHGFGKVEPEPNEPVFHAPWEGRCFALNRAMGYAGLWTIDKSRAAREQLPPDVYLASSYYKKWELGLENLIVELGLAGADEIEAGHALRPGKTLRAQACRRRGAEHAVTRFLRAAGAGAGALQTRRPRSHQEHSPGDAYAAAALCARLRRRGRSKSRLSRVSRHSRDRQGRESAMALYGAVRGRELWGDDADPSLKVSIEAFEPYLEPA